MRVIVIHFVFQCCCSSGLLILTNDTMCYCMVGYYQMLNCGFAKFIFNLRGRGSDSEAALFVCFWPPHLQLFFSYSWNSQFTQLYSFSTFRCDDGGSSHTSDLQLFSSFTVYESKMNINKCITCKSSDFHRGGEKR